MRLMIFMVMYFSAKNCADPLVNPNNFTLNCPFKKSTLHLKNTNVVSGSDPDHGPRAAFGLDLNPVSWGGGGTDIIADKNVG